MARPIGARTAAAESGISKSSVQRYFTLFGIKPHRTKSFKLSNDALFIEKLRAVVGLYLNPPDNALVLCVDEKSQVLALERTHPMLPLGLGYVQGITHDYKRHGTTTLFAALDVQTGTVFTDCKPRHRHQEFLSFLRTIEQNVSPDLNIHLIVDNYCTHKHAKVRARLARRPRWQIHYTPTYSSWLNMVELRVLTIFEGLIFTLFEVQFPFLFPHCVGENGNRNWEADGQRRVEGWAADQGDITVG